jgi:hypothetical protein
MAASTRGKIATGERRGKPVRRVGSFGDIGERPQLTGPLCAGLGGFSIHANVFIEPGKVDKLEKLCRYVARPAISEQRLTRLDNGDISYSLKKSWSDGTYAVQFSPTELIEKLIGLIPQPRIHMTRYFGVLAPNHKWRSKIVPGPPKTEAAPDAAVASVPKKRRMSWAELLKRVFQIDITTCRDCGGTLRFIAVVMERSVVVKILKHLGLPSEIPRWSHARAPPSQVGFDF